MIFLIALLVLGFIIIALVDFPSVLQAKQSKEILVYSGLFALAFVLSLLQVIEIEIPSPAKGLEFLMKNVLHIAYKS